jgi:hypothetical protein
MLAYSIFDSEEEESKSATYSKKRKDENGWQKGNHAYHHNAQKMK